MTQTSQPYRSRIRQTALTEPPPKVAMPEKIDTQQWALPGKSGWSLITMTLLLGVSCYLAFTIYDAVNGLIVRYNTSPLSAIVLGSLLGLFVLCLLAMIMKEWLGIRRLNAYLGTTPDWAALAQSEQPKSTRRAIARHAAQFASDSYATSCFKRYQMAINSDLTAAELVSLYHEKVTHPVEQKAREVLKRESVTSGSLTFISPNNLIQTMVVSWVSLRTVKRLALVYGLRPGKLGNIRLMKILLQNLAAYSIFDMATDEVANQLGGALSAKVMENSAEAVAAGALNMRLGRVLIRLLSQPVK